MDIIIPIIALLIGGGIGFAIFRYILAKKYNFVLESARKEA